MPDNDRPDDYDDQSDGVREEAAPARTVVKLVAIAVGDPDYCQACNSDDDPDQHARLGLRGRRDRILALFIPLIMSLRRGGYGPPLGHGGPVTRKGKARVNRSYEKHGWAKPFDEDGNRLPRSKRNLPDP